MVIITCGMDNSGKTTLINTLKKIHGDAIEVVKPPGPFNSSEELQNWLNPEMNRMKTFQFDKSMIIYDRFPLISEPIYGSIIRGESMIAKPDFSKVFQEAIFPVTIIYCRPPNEKILDFGEREQMDGVINKSLELLIAYDELMLEISEAILPLNSKLSLVLYDWTNPISHNIMLDKISGEIRGFEFFKNYME